MSFDESAEDRVSIWVKIHCKDCQYFKFVGEGAGECRIRAPGAGVKQWPTVSIKDWCGEAQKVADVVKSKRSIHSKYPPLSMDKEYPPTESEGDWIKCPNCGKKRGGLSEYDFSNLDYIAIDCDTCGFEMELYQKYELYVTREKWK